MLRGVQAVSARELDALLPSILDQAFKGKLQQEPIIFCIRFKLEKD